MVDVPLFEWPAQAFWRNDATSFGLAVRSFTLDSTADRYALIFQAPKTGTLDRMEFNVSGGTTLADMKAGWQNLDLATGYPNGTYTHWRTLTGYSSGWLTPSFFDSNGDGTGSRRTVTRGDYVCFVLEPVGATPNITIGATRYGGGVFAALPASVRNTGTGYGTDTDMMQCALFYQGESNATFLNPFILPATAFGNNNFSSGGPRQVGAVFTMPFKARAVGVGLRGDLDVDVIARLFDSPTNDLIASACSIDKDTTAAQSGTTLIEVMFPTAHVLNAGSSYRLALENSAATACNLTHLTIGSSSCAAAMAGGSTFVWTETSLAYASLVNEASWSQNTTRIPHIWLLIDQLDDGAGGSGGGAIVVPQSFSPMGAF
jgi:hypothetical protein